MKKRTQIEAELAQLALEIGGKSHSEAAKAVLDLYKGLALLEAEETIEQQLAAAQQDMQSQLRAKIAELQSEVGVPEIDVPTPAPEAPATAAPATTVAPEEEDNQLSLVDVAEEIEKEEAAKAAQILPEEIEADEPVLKSREDRTVFQLDEAVEPAPAAPEPPAEDIAEPVMVKSESVAEKAQSTEKKSLNDRLAGGALKFGLNDRIGFVKDLFDGSAEDFNRVVSQLNTLGSLGEAQDFLTTHIAPEYGWADNEETAERFMAAVEQRFG
jgi:ribosomal protein L22